MNLISSIELNCGGPGSGRHKESEWTRESKAGKNVDVDNDWVMRVTKYTHPVAGEVIVKQGDGKYIIQSKLGNQNFTYGSTRQNGSATNSYVKRNFGFKHIYRPHHPFAKKDPKWSGKDISDE